MGGTTKRWGPRQAAKYAKPRSGKVEPGKEASAGADPGAAARKPRKATHATRRPLLAAVPKLGAHKGMDGETDYDRQQRDVPNQTFPGPCFSHN
eukprot:1141940-Pelagomonas_calceolata.AAC.3